MWSPHAQELHLGTREGGMLTAVKVAEFPAAARAPLLQHGTAAAPAAHTVSSLHGG